MTSLSEAARPWTRESLAAHIEVNVLAKSLQTGEALPSERQLAGLLGVSRSLVREVLRGLEQRGLLDVRPGKGAYARTDGDSQAPRSMHDAYWAAASTQRHLAEARYAIERQTAGLAAHRATPGYIASLTAACADLDQPSGPASITADIAFHALVARAAGNPVLSLTLESLQAAIFQALLESTIQGDEQRRHADLHAAVLTEIARADSAAASSAMSDLLEFEARTWKVDEPMHGGTTDLVWTGSRLASPADLVAQAVRRYLTLSKE